MSEHRAIVRWSHAGPDFLKGKYSRAHTWTFDGGLTVAASASPSIVPAPWSDPAGIDPEEAFIAAVASCHMLWYLHMARDAGFVVDRYEDEAVGAMTPNKSGGLWISTVILKPKIAYGDGLRPTPEDEERLHHAAHENCFIANSIRTAVIVKRPG